MYYILECYGPTEEDRRYIDKVPDIEGVNWSLGRQFSVSIPNPLEVELDSVGIGIMMPMFKRGIVLLRNDLVGVIEKAGVDNIEVYPVFLIDPLSGVILQDYSAINIIGLVSCADLAKSSWVAPSGSVIVDVDFDSLEIDESKAHGLLMFRLAECVSAIVVHKKIREAMENADIKHIDFVEPKDWIG